MPLLVRWAGCLGVARNTQAVRSPSLFDRGPECLHALQTLRGRVAGNRRRIDGADGGANDPVGHDAGFMQGLVHAYLTGTQRTAALKHQHQLPRQ